MSLDIILRFPGSEQTAHHQNITDNLFEMAAAAGLSECLWPGDKNNIEVAADLIEPLRSGIELLKSDPDRFRVYDSPKGWGTYDQFVPWLEELLKECIDCPECTVSIF